MESLRNRNQKWTGLVLILVLSTAAKVHGDMGSLGLEQARFEEPKSPFSIVIDGGSTGSRLHIFEFVVDENGREECVRRGSERSHTPMSAFGRLPEDQHLDLNPESVAAHMLPLFEYAAAVIPSQYHDSTLVKYQATAGMRLLEEEEQDLVYDALFEGLRESESFVFSSMKREDIATLSGELEGFYGAVAANYLKGVVDTTLRTVDDAEGKSMCDHDAKQHGPLGALDMGGASTQIVYMPNTPLPTCEVDDSENDEDSEMDALTCSADARLNEDEFFSISHVSYGADQMRQRLWNTLVQDRIREDSAIEDESCSSKTIENPCANVGYELEWEGYKLIGSGDVESCVKQIHRLIPHHQELSQFNDDNEEVVVGGVAHPTVRGKFYAMSLFFFSLDSLRVYSHPKEDAHSALNLSWPTPSIQELYDALEGLCSRQWKDDLEGQHIVHTFTRQSVLPHRCFESVYMVTLLRDGYGFAPDSRDITFSFLVDGSEVEWSLGMALAMHAADASESPDYSALSVEENCEEFPKNESKGEPTEVSSTWSPTLAAESEEDTGTAEAECTTFYCRIRNSALLQVRSMMKLGLSASNLAKLTGKSASQN